MNKKNLLHFPITQPMGCSKCVKGEFFVGKHNISNQNIVFCASCGYVNGQLVPLTNELKGVSKDNKVDYLPDEDCNCGLIGASIDD